MNHLSFCVRSFCHQAWSGCLIVSPHKLERSARPDGTAVKRLTARKKKNPLYRKRGTEGCMGIDHLKVIYRLDVMIGRSLSTIAATTGTLAATGATTASTSTATATSETAATTAIAA